LLKLRTSDHTQSDASGHQTASFCIEALGNDPTDSNLQAVYDIELSQSQHMLAVLGASGGLGGD